MPGNGAFVSLGACQREDNLVRKCPAVGLTARHAGLLLVVGLAPSCIGGEPPPPSDLDLRLELGILDETAIHRIDLSYQGDGIRILPRSTEIRTGDIVQFVTLDHRVYLVRFGGAALYGAAVEFLRATRQERPPPLVEQGARLVLTFEDAPFGTYPFVVDGNGLSVEGEIRVLPPE